MWRDETGLVEMLFTYIAGVQEFESYEKWRPVLVEILSYHESRRCKFMVVDEYVEETCESQDYETKHIEEHFDEAIPSLMKGREEPEKVQYEDIVAPVVNSDSDSKCYDHVESSTSRYVELELNAVEELVIDEKDEVIADTLQIHQDFNGVPSYTKQAFERNYEIVNHLNMWDEQRRTTDTPFLCLSCGKSYHTRSYLVVHQRLVHSGKKTHQCQTCSKWFKLKASLRVHERSHTGERPYPCKWCEKSFSRSNVRKEHERTHTGERPYPCKWCEKTFLQSGNLKKHERTHTGERPYPCKYCEKAFDQSGNLKRHERTHR